MTPEQLTILIATEANLAGAIETTVALTAIIGLLKAVVDNSEAAVTASNQLDSALHTQGSSLAENVGWIDAFIKSNARFIDNQYAAEEAIAKVIRAGADQDTTMRMATDAMDLAALKGTSYAEALDSLELAASGNTRGLRDLGFSSKEVAEIMKEATDKGGGFNGLLAALEPRISGAAAATSQLKQSSNEANQAWQNLTGSGSALAGALAKDEEGLAVLFDALSGLTEGPLGKFVGLLGQALSYSTGLGNLAMFLGDLANLGNTGASPVPVEPVGNTQGWPGAPPSTTWTKEDQQSSRDQQLGVGITINNYGIQDPAAAGYLTAAQLAPLLAPGGH